MEDNDLEIETHLPNSWWGLDLTGAYLQGRAAERRRIKISNSNSLSLNENIWVIQAITFVS